MKRSVNLPVGEMAGVERETSHRTSCREVSARRQRILAGRVRPGRTFDHVHEAHLANSPHLQVGIQEPGGFHEGLQNHGG